MVVHDAHANAGFALGGDPARFVTTDERRAVTLPKGLKGPDILATGAFPAFAHAADKLAAAPTVAFKAVDLEIDNTIAATGFAFVTLDFLQQTAGGFGGTRRNRGIGDRCGLG